MASALAEARQDKSTKDVLLERGIVEAVEYRSQDSITIDLLVGNVTQRFTSDKRIVGQLARDDSIIFTYMRQTGEIVRIAAIDVSTPDRVTIREEQQIYEYPEPLSTFLGRIFNRGDLYEQGVFAILWPWSSSIALFILGLEVWDWGGWSWIFFALWVIWFILGFAMVSRHTNYEAITKMKLDIGYVHETEERKFEDSESSPNSIQNIVITDTAPPKSLNKRMYSSYDKTFAVQRGDLLILIIDHNGRISNLRNESLLERQWTPEIDEVQARERAAMESVWRYRWAEEELREKLLEEAQQSTERVLGVEAEQFNAIATDFFEKVLGHEVATSVLFTDGSSLHDFESFQPIDVSLRKIHDIYGIDVSDVDGALLYRIFARIAETQSNP